MATCSTPISAPTASSTAPGWFAATACWSAVRVGCSRAVKLTEADLPLFGLPVQILVMGVLMARWDAESQSG